MTPPWLAAALASAACWVLLTTRSAEGADSSAPPARSRTRLAWVAAAVAGVALLLAVIGRIGVLSLILFAGGTVAALAVRGLVADRRRRRLHRKRQLAVIELCDSLAAELRAGLPAGLALVRASTGWAEWEPVVSAVRVGGDVPAALRRCACTPGADGLRVVGAAWEVAGHAGAALGVVLDRVAAGMRSDEEARAEVVAALGPPRATAKMLAVLPVFGLGLGVSMGARPVQFLLRTGAGLLCLTLGVCLALLGVWWVERLASAAEV